MGIFQNFKLLAKKDFFQNVKEKLFLVFRNFHWETALMLHLHFLIRSLNLGFHQSQGPHPSLLDLPLAKQNLNNPL